MSKLYPLFFEPVLKHYLWGGRNLEKFGRELPNNKPVSESWEIAGHKDGMTVVRNGIYTGKTLDQMLNILGVDLIGHNNQWALDRGKFPLLVKLLDADRRLSVQVHPDDDYAQKHEGNELGKAEMWVVLWTKPGAEVIIGFSEEVNPAAFEQAIKTGTIENHLHHIPIKAGDHICVPPGTLHAILEGSVIAEIQQNSNTTYRVYDWNRTDTNGRSRQLHINEAIDVIDFQIVNAKLPEPCILSNSRLTKHERLCQNKYFTTERITLDQGGEFSGECDGSSLEIWGVISGKAFIAGEQAEGVQFYLLPAGMGTYSIKADPKCVLLRTYTRPNDRI